jgi:hypothetical protein
LVGGIIALIFGAILLLAMVFFGLDRWWRLLLFLPFWAGATGLLQAREQT